MAEVSINKKTPVRRMRHRGRASQVIIYLGKQLRFFINESDWKVLPMAAIIAALVGMVIRKRLFINMEGSLIGAFALTCVAIWNGCFNSIQAVCRERPIIKREHRSGMHISSYVAAHMIYQLVLCAAQTALTMYVLVLMEVKFPVQGFMTPLMVLDVGISMLLISYAADMLSLFLSSIAHTTTAAMTLMPFVLIFQLVFSGGLIPLPAWSQKLSNFTISNYGIKAIAAQSGYNELPMDTVWNTLKGMKNNEIGGTYTLGQLLDLLDQPAIEDRRDMEVLKSYTVGEVAEILSSAEQSLHLREKEITHPMTVREIIDLFRSDSGVQKLISREIVPGSGISLSGILDDLVSAEEMRSVLDREIGATITLGDVLDFLHAQDIAEAEKDRTLNAPVTLGDIVDFLKNNAVLQEQCERTFTLKTTVGEVFNLFGEENVKDFVQKKTSAASYKADYERSESNIIGNWLMLGVFVIGYAFLSTLVLEMIDKDKR